MVSVDAHPDAKHAVTHYRIISARLAYSMLEVTLDPFVQGAQMIA
jgi:hypothetical protein